MSIDVVKVKNILESGNSRGIALLSVLNKQHKFAEVFETQIGKALLDDAVIRANELLMKIVNETSSSEERAEYRVLRNLLNVWLDKISAYLKNLEKISKGE